MLQPILLAAGKGTRMRSLLPKVLYPVAGKPMLSWTLEMFREVQSAKTPLIVVGHGARQVQEAFPNNQFVIQDELSGTASAVSVCIPHFTKSSDLVFIVNGDNPFLSAESVRSFEATYAREQATLVLGVVAVPNFEDTFAPFLHFGRVHRDNSGRVSNIVEYKNATDSERSILEVNAGVYCVHPQWLENALGRITRNELTHEYYLTDIVALAKDDGVTIVTQSLALHEGLGINSPEDAQRAESLLFKAK